MASGDTTLSLASTALFHLGAAPLSSFTAPATALERRVVAQYQPTLNLMLREKPWTFAIVNTAFVDPVTPAVPPALNSWEIPADCMRLLRERCPGDWHYEPEWFPQGGFVWQCSSCSPQIRYVSNAADPAIYDPLFSEAFSLRLARRSTELATQSSQKKQDLSADYNDVMNRAGAMNAWEQPQGSTHAPDDAFSWLRDRSQPIY